MQNEILNIFDRTFAVYEEAIQQLKAKAGALQAEQNNKIADLEAKVQDLSQLLAKRQIDSRPHVSRYSIDAGIGTISFGVSGSIQLQELIEELDACIKRTSVPDTIRILKIAR